MSRSWLVVVIVLAVVEGVPGWGGQNEVCRDDKAR